MLATGSRVPRQFIHRLNHFKWGHQLNSLPNLTPIDVFKPDDIVLA